jgi:hypothetical protein
MLMSHVQSNAARGCRCRYVDAHARQHSCANACIMCWRDVEQKVCRRGAEGLSAVGCMAVPCKCVVCKFKVRRCAESAKILFPFLFWRACVTVVVGNSGQKRGEAVVRNMVKQS